MEGWCIVMEGRVGGGMVYSREGQRVNTTLQIWYRTLWYSTDMVQNIMVQYRYGTVQIWYRTLWYSTDMVQNIMVQYRYGTVQIWYRTLWYTTDMVQSGRDPQHLPWSE